MSKIIGEKNGVRLVVGEFHGFTVLRRETADGRILAAVGIRPEYLPGLIVALQERATQVAKAKTKAKTAKATKAAAVPAKTPVLATTNTAETAEDVRVLLRRVLQKLGGA
jgi:hypothetical protein